jgi:predicted transcriptional regulator
LAPSAKRAGVHRVTISYIESGKIDKARFATMRAVVRALENAGVEFTDHGVHLNRPS